MKKCLMGLCTAILLAACGKDDDEKSGATLLEVQVGGNYFGNGELGYVIASKADGSLLDYEPISNNTSVTLQTDEPGVASFTVTIFAKRMVAQAGQLQMQSFLDIAPGSSWTLDRPLPAAQPTNSVKVNIENTGSVAQWPLWASGGRSGFTMEYPNGGLRVSMPTDEPIAFYNIYKSMDDNTVRYVFDDDMQPGTEETYDHASLPIIASPTTFNFPQGANIYAHNILGDPVGPKDGLMEIARSYPFGGSFDHYLPPTNLFERFYTFVSGAAAFDSNFSTAIFSNSIAQDFVEPSFDLEVVENTTGFTFTSSPGFDFFSSYFNLNSSGEVGWTVNGKRAASLDFVFPTLPDELLAEFPSAALNLNQVNTAGIKYEPSIGYDAFLKNATEGTALSFDRYDVVAKQP